MRRPAIYVSTIVLTGAATGILATTAAHHLYFVGRAVNNPADAAFRDGLFHGRLDAERGRKQHLSSGRWNLNACTRAVLLTSFDISLILYDKAAIGWFDSPL